MSSGGLRGFHRAPGAGVEKGGKPEQCVEFKM